MTFFASPPAPFIKGELVYLKQLDETVLEPYLEMLADPESQRLTATKATFTREKIQTWLDTRPEQRQRCDWAIFEADTDEFIGEIVLNELNEKNNSMNLRISLRGPAWFGRGFGSAAINLVLAFVFDQLKLTKLTLEVLVDNARAIAAYEKVGFQQGREFSEGKLRYLRMSCDRYDYIRAISETKMAEHIDLEKWQFGFDSAKRRAGLCNYTDKRITISRYLVDIHSVDETMQVVLHEVAHAMSGKVAGHSKVWLATAKSIGYRAERFTGKEIAEETAAWIGVCPQGHRHYRYRQPKTPMSCGVCNKGYSRANLIRWQHRDELIS